MDDQHQPMGAKAQAAARAAARDAGLTSPSSSDDPTTLSPQLDAAIAAQRVQSGGFYDRIAASNRSTGVVTQSPADSSLQPSQPITTRGDVIRDIQLGWESVFVLAFKFTAALAVIGAVPFLIVLFLLTR